MEAFQLCKEYLGGGWARMTHKDFRLTVMGSVSCLMNMLLLSRSEEYYHRFSPKEIKSKCR